MEIFEYFQKGGPVMYLLLLCSVCVVAILIERFSFFKKAGKNIQKFVDDLPSAIAGKPFAEAASSCEKENNAASYVASEGLKAAAEGRDAQLALDMAYNNAAAQMRTGMGYLAMIVTLSPLLGLLGTIFGMINSFNIFSLQAGQPLAITGGIGEALIATGTGLCVAIFALVVHTYFAQKMDRILTCLDNTEAIVTSEIRKRG